MSNDPSLSLIVYLRFSAAALMQGPTQGQKDSANPVLSTLHLHLRYAMYTSIIATLTHFRLLCGMRCRLFVFGEAPG